MMEFPHVEPLFNLSVKNEKEEDSLNNTPVTCSTEMKKDPRSEEDGNSSNSNNNSINSTNGISCAQSSSKCSVGYPPCLAVRENDYREGQEVENVRIFKDFKNEVRTTCTRSSLSQLETTFKMDPLPVTIDRDTDLFSIPFSSGTTGDPKAVAKLHRAMLCLKYLASNEFGFATKTPDFHPVISCHAPFSHVGGMAMLIQSLMTGSTAVILNGFNPNNYLDLVCRFKVSINLHFTYCTTKFHWSHCICLDAVCKKHDLYIKRNVHLTSSPLFHDPCIHIYLKSREIKMCKETNMKKLPPFSTINPPHFPVSFSIKKIFHVL